MVSPFCMCFFSFLYKDCSQRLLPPAAALSTHAPDRFKPPGGLVPAIAWFSNGIPAGKSPLLQENHLQMSDASAKVCCSEQERAREREYMSRFPTFILSSCEDFVNGKSTVMQQAECLRYQPSPDNPDQIPQ